MRLNQVTVGATDFAASRAFYLALGLRLIVDSPPRYARFETPSGETFSIHAAEAAASSTIVYFEVDDVDSFLAERKLVADRGPVDEPWLWREARLVDSAGNAICLYQAGANRRFPPWRIDGRKG